MSDSAGGTCFVANPAVGNYKQAKILGNKIVMKVRKFRKENGGEYNRTIEDNGSESPILRFNLEENPYACSVIIECAFYTNMKDVLWMFRNLRGFTEAIAEGAIEYLTEYNLI